MQDLDKLKKSLDIVAIAELYGELEKTGSNYRYKDDHSIVISPSKQIFSNFNGEIEGGSVLDLIAYMEKLELKDAIKRLKELAGADTYKIDPQKQLKRKKETTNKKEVDFSKLGYIGKLHLKEMQNYNFVHTAIEQKDKSFKDFVLIPEPFRKLFETTLLPIEYSKKIEYLKNNILGYDNFFNCPSLIIRDNTRKIVDIISYRPNKPKNYKNWSNPKYIYKNSHNRGKNFLFPFQIEFETIIKKQTTDRFFIVGEGIKNAFNGLLYSTPYITLESTSNKISQNLKDYILNLIDRGYNLLTMFDGDKAGEKAYNKFKEQTNLQVENFFNFNSGLDFVDYIQGGSHE